MQRFQFDQSPAWVLVCLLIAAAYAWWLYRPVTSWSKWLNRSLAAFRFIVVFLISLLLLGPVIRLVINESEAPQVVVLMDDSRSVLLADSARARGILADISLMRKNLEAGGYEVTVRGLSGNTDPVTFSGATSDIGGALRQVETDFDGRNLKSVVLISDGIFNSGISPAHSAPAVPVHTIGVGDTVQRKDVQIRFLEYNKVAYQGNRIPIRAEIAAFGVESGTCLVEITSKGKVVAREQRPFQTGRNFMVIDFQVEAAAPGLRRFDVSVAPVSGEVNLTNNRAIAVVEVIDGKKKILVVAPSPHPDLSAFRAVIEQNEHYEMVLHIPGVMEAAPDLLQPGAVDLMIAHQSPDVKGLTAALIQTFLKAKRPVLFVVGQQSDLRAISALPVPVTYERSGQWDEVFGIPSSGPTLFQLPENTGAVMSRMPPLVTPFGKFTAPADARVLLGQRIGNVVTERPLLFSVMRDEQRLGFLMGEGWWKWRLREHSLYDQSETTDAILQQLIQFLSTTDDKRKFRFFPLKSEFSESGPVVFEAQVFNDLYQPVYGLPVKVDIRPEDGSKQSYSMVPGPTSSRLSIALPEGVYQYSATLERDGRTEKDAGVFSVVSLQLESQDLTADFGLLRRIATTSGGKFFLSMPQDMAASIASGSAKAASRITSEETYRPLIDWAWLFALLVMLVSLEWFLRRYHGGY